eukprot:TRINITY_DN1412_c0_g1_i1.p1 TRINITY_DN1412_c0_g1~~TRINITY_DN1412_c0_g1_i1.p1  ORF type:complete len:639 (+),score=152.51 TRINITY_DN1412_c0_g1_i1:263-2179(+)
MNILSVHKEIGHGAFGNVFLATWQEQFKEKRTIKNFFLKSPNPVVFKSLVAVKQMSKANVVDKNCIKQTLAERDIVGSLHHPFVCQVHMMFQDAYYLYLVQDWWPRGDLWELLHARRGFSETECRWFGSQLVLSLEYVHSQKIIHRDLKPGNILVDDNYYIALTDFGISKRLESDDMVFAKEGTKGYTAPEVLMKRRHGCGVDWFALGALLYYLFYGRKPFGRRKDSGLVVAQRTCKGIISFPKSPFFGPISPELKSLIRLLIAPDVKDRLGGNSLNGSSQIKKHPFFKGIDWEALSRKEMSLNLGPAPTIADNASIHSFTSVTSQGSNHSNCGLTNLSPAQLEGLVGSMSISSTAQSSPIGSRKKEFGFPSISNCGSVIWKPPPGKRANFFGKPIDRPVTEKVIKTITLLKRAPANVPMTVGDRVEKGRWLSDNFSVSTSLVRNNEVVGGDNSKMISIDLQNAFSGFDMKELPKHILSKSNEKDESSEKKSHIPDKHSHPSSPSPSNFQVSWQGSSSQNVKSLRQLSAMAQRRSTERRKHGSSSSSSSSRLRSQSPMIPIGNTSTSPQLRGRKHIVIENPLCKSSSPCRSPSLSSRKSLGFQPPRKTRSTRLVASPSPRKLFQTSNHITKHISLPRR